MRLDRVDKISAWRLCLGCGVCRWACSRGAISLVDVVDDGIRPVVDDAKCAHCGACAAVCPGIELDHEPITRDAIAQLACSWGRIWEIWEGYASDPEIRFKASSGGIATALAKFLLEKNPCRGVLHVGPDQDFPWKNAVTFSRDSSDLFSCLGSRYAPAAPCSRLDWIKNAGAPCVFVGKPCDVAALTKARKADPLLDRNIDLTISIFCAGTPSTAGTLAILQAMGITSEQVESFRYRGWGWPGRARASLKAPGGAAREMPYHQFWDNILTKHVPLRCRLCPDTTGQFADIACGDPWYRPVEPDEPGRSLVLARTQRGRRLLHEAMDGGYVTLQPVEPDILPRSQKALLQRRRHLWGRLAAMRLLAVPAPCYRGFSLFANWRKLPVREKLQSIAGTVKRIILRGGFRPQKLNTAEEAKAQPIPAN